MGTNTNIQWCNKTWNPWRGCRKITAGCANCYMFTGQERYGNDPGVIVRTKTWADPLKWQREAERLDTTFRVFTCSWSDFFIEEADQWRSEAWDLIRRCPRLQFQILTKRTERIADHLPPGWAMSVVSGFVGGGPFPNVWLGVSAENRTQGLPRIDILRKIPATIRFLSVEPLLEDLGEIDLGGIEWVICGGESGPGFRPMKREWAESVHDQCRAAGVPFFFKQIAALHAGAGADLLGGGTHQYPVAPPQPVGQMGLFYSPRAQPRPPPSGHRRRRRSRP